MKKVIVLFIVITLIPCFGFSQTADKFDYISPFNEGFSAVKKGNQWAFINNQGTIVINFRDDLVLTETDNENYPIFKNGRSIISQEKDGISYFGYIDTSGKTVIEPQYLNATNFDKEFAIVIKIHKNLLGKNDVLNKDVVRYESSEVLIDFSGEISEMLTEAKGVVLSKNYLKNSPKITSKIISENLVVTLGKDNKWEVKRIKTD